MLQAYRVEPLACVKARPREADRGWTDDNCAERFRSFGKPVDGAESYDLFAPLPHLCLYRLADKRLMDLEEAILALRPVRRVFEKDVPMEGS